MKNSHRTIIIVYIVVMFLLFISISVAFFAVLNNPEAIGKFFGKIERGYEQTENK